MGARICCPDEKVMAICGDGGFMMNSQELETAVRLGMNFENWGLDYGNPDFVRYAESYGAHGHRVERTEDLESTLESCLNADGVHLIEVPVDYSHNHKLLEGGLVCPL